LIPAFAHGKTKDLLAAASVGRLPTNGLTNEEDWRYYYVNFFVDRDMYMRYLGGGVGHYQVPIPPEDEAAPTAEPAPDSDEEEFPSMIPLPQIPPPPSPEATSGPLPDEELEDPAQNSDSDDSEAARTPVVSDSDTDSDLGENFQDDDDEGDWGADDDDLGPEDGEGVIQDEMEEGYTPL
ncbi:hypothetical protein C8R45DRAFT_1159936, partial [Mycena sanguinolenta]